MKWNLAVLAFLLGVVASPAVSRSAIIDVVIVFEATAFQASSNRTNEANAIIANANNALALSGLAHRYNLKYLHTQALAFASGPGTTDSQVKAAMTNDPQIPQLRQTHAADLVVLVTEYLNKDSGQPHCGAALGTLLDEIPRDVNRDIAFRMAIDRGCTDTTDPLAITVAAHELGHLLHLDHQLTVAPDPDTKPTTPVTYNHPDILQQRATMMVGGPTACAPATCNIVNLHSDPQGFYPGTSLARGHSYDRNDRRMIDEAFPVIARYRPVPAPPVTLLAPTCALEFVGCSNGKRRYLVSFYQNDSQPFPVGDADYSINGGSTWYDLYGGIDACVPVVPSTPWIVRARVRSSYGDSPYCTIQIQSGSCSGGDL